MMMIIIKVKVFKVNIGVFINFGYDFWIDFVELSLESV